MEDLDLDELRATYDHPTDRSVIELIDRLEQAELNLERALKVSKFLVSSLIKQGERLEQAEQAAARVHALNNELSWSPNNVAIVQRYRDALDGEPNE